MSTPAKPLAFTLPSPFSLPIEPRLLPASDANARKTRILVADDDGTSRELMGARLAAWDFEVVMTRDGNEAMAELRKKDAPTLAIIDWMMPGLDGLEVCRRVRESDRVLYIILLTARGGKDSVVEGLTAGADDYLVKPFDAGELHARILVGLRVMRLQAALAERVRELEWASSELRSLRRDA